MSPSNVVDREEAMSGEEMPEWANVLRIRRDIELRLSQAKIEARTGDLVPQGLVSKIERGKKHPVYDLTNPQLLAYIYALAWSIEEFIERTGLDIPIYDVLLPFVKVTEDVEPKREIPLYDGIGAGPGFAFGEQIGTAEIPQIWHGDYRAFVVHGNSMEPEIFDGWSVIVKMNELPTLGDTVLAYHPDHELIVKRLIIENNEQREAILKSNNPDYAEILVCEGCVIKGVVKRIVPKPIDL